MRKKRRVCESCGLDHVFSVKLVYDGRYGMLCQSLAAMGECCVVNPGWGASAVAWSSRG